MKEVSPIELKEWMENNKPFVLIDIREDWERAHFNIGGIHIPMGELIERQSEIPGPDNDVVLYCEKGVRSTIAIQRFETLGYNHLLNLSGGVHAWRALA